MGEYLLLWVVLLNMVLISKTWPREMGESLHLQKRTVQFNRQGYFQKREVSTVNPKKDKKNDDIIFPNATPSSDDVISKFQNGQDSETLCATTVRTIYPKVLKNTNDIEKFIVNVGNYTQGLIFETCMENTKCRFESLFQESGYTSECTQKYSKRQLLALSDDQTTVAFDTFIVPSGCVCSTRLVKTK